MTATGDLEAPSENSAASAARLELLKLDYEMAREDDRFFINAQATVLGIAIALVAIMFPLVSQTCVMQGALQRDDCSPVSGWVVALAPLIPLGLGSFAVALGLTTTLRSYYLRALEAELQAYGDRRMALAPLPPLSLIGLQITVQSLRRGRVGLRLLYGLLVAAAIAVFGGITVYIVWNLNGVVQVASAGLYAVGILVLLTEIYRASSGGRSFFVSAVRRYLMRRGEIEFFDRWLSTFENKERSLLGYLALPRPKDMVKWLFFPATFLIGLWASYGESWWTAMSAPVPAWDAGLSGLTAWLGSVSDSPLGRFVLLFLIMEYLLYEARYQWNDIRGVAEDAETSVAKRRLPIGPGGADAGRSIAASWTVAILRIGLAFGIAAAAGHRLLPWTTVLAASIFGVGVIYEALRSRPVRRGREFTATATGVAIWILVGAGYVIRGAAGLIAGGVPPRDLAVLLSIGALLSFGTMFVTMTWLYDASSYCWDAPKRGVAVRFRSALTRKPHLAALLAFAGARPGAVDDGPGVPGGYHARPLATATLLWTPWNIAVIISATLAGGLGAALATLTATPLGTQRDLTTVGTGAALGLVAVVGPVLLPRGWLRYAALLVAAVGVPALLLPLLGERSILAALPWILVVAWYVWFRDQSMASLDAGLKPLVNAVRVMWWWVLGLVAGQATVRFLKRARGSAAPLPPGPRTGPEGRP